MKIHSTAKEALQKIQSHQTVFIHGAAATPHRLIEGLLERAKDLENVELIHLHTAGDAAYADPKYARNFRVSNLFVGPNIRKNFDFDRVDYIPCFLSEMPDLFRSGRKKVHVALLHVSSPDAHGYCTLGTSVDTAKAAAECADYIIAQINPQMPRVHGDGFIHIDDINDAIEVNEPLSLGHCEPVGDLEKKIGASIAELIEDGSTLQMGIGAIPDAALSCLGQHKDLGVHTEMWSNGLLPLLKSGVVTNSKKAVHPGKTVSAFVNGSKELYDFIHDNPSVIQLEASYVNNTAVIRRNPKVVAINSAVEIDLTGQVCADSVGCRVISGVGGQMDFVRGASLSPGGKAFFAMTSRSKKGQPRIVPFLRQGAGVVTTRAHIHFVATEYGVVDLYGKTLGERAKLLISIAHPEDRESLQAAWSKIKG
jgi:acyl-CoA hydrolase